MSMRWDTTFRQKAITFMTFAQGSYNKGLEGFRVATCGLKPFFSQPFNKEEVEILQDAHLEAFGFALEDEDVARYLTATNAFIVLLGEGAYYDPVLAHQLYCLVAALSRASLRINTRTA